MTESSRGPQLHTQAHSAPAVRLKPIPPPRKWANNLNVRVRDQELNLFLNCDEYPTIGSIVPLVSEKLKMDMSGLVPVVNNKKTKPEAQIYRLRQKDIVFKQKDWIDLNLTMGQDRDAKRLELQAPLAQSLASSVRVRLNPRLQEKGQKLDRLLLIRVSGGQRVLLSTAKMVGDLIAENKLAEGDLIDVRCMTVPCGAPVRKEKRKIYVFVGSAERTDTRQEQSVTPRTTFEEVVQNHPDIDGPARGYCLQPVRQNGVPVRAHFITDLNLTVEAYTNVNSFVIVPSREMPPRESKAVRCKIISPDHGLGSEAFRDDCTLTSIARSLSDNVSKVSFHVNGKAIPIADGWLRIGDLAEGDAVIEIVIAK